MSENGARTRTVTPGAHTPGEWVHEGFVGTVGAHVVSSAKGHVFVANLGGPPDHPTVVANAHLIAAAPDMLDVLQTIENDVGQVPEWLWDRIQVVIAQATGAIIEINLMEDES